ncbi:MAG TPA: cytochrome c [Burkholderiales bacterium]|nr:cytochrome c [Burkholderiales bacterium]
MNRRQTRLFAIVSTAIAVVVFLGMTIDSHRQFPKLTNEDAITPEVLAGKTVWHKYNCTNCHTLLGEGAYYAPDLTKIAAQRGREYLRAFIKDPAAFYDEQKYRRVMPKQGLSDREIDDVITFLTWISKIDTQGWPPRPILVSGSAIPGANLATATPVPPGTGTAPTPPVPGAEKPTPASDEPVARGQALFNNASSGCFACHSVAPGVNLAGPTLAGIGTRAEATLKNPAYKGAAKDAVGYVRESITDPHAYLVPGATYSANGRSFMPDHFGKTLQPAQIDDLVAYLTTLK